MSIYLIYLKYGAQGYIVSTSSKYSIKYISLFTVTPTFVREIYT